MAGNEENISIPVILGEGDYLQRMLGEVAQWRKQYLHSGRLKSFDGTPIQYYYAINPKPRGSMVMLHGFCEFIGKYREMLYTFFQAGYNVFFYEQRGHGRSGKVTDNGTIHVKDFSEYEKDLKFLLDHKILPMLGQTLPEDVRREHPLFLFGHSMGGAVSALFLEDYPEYFDAAVLSSPMCRMNTGDLAPWKISAMMLYTKLFHQQKKPLFGKSGFDPDESFEDSCGDSFARFDYVLRQRRNYPEYQTGGTTLGWSSASIRSSKRMLKNAGKIAVPVLLLQAGEDTLVENDAQDAFAEAADQVQIVRIENAKHELMNGNGKTRRLYYQEIFRFLMTHEADLREENSSQT